ncbi:MAG: DNA polymerase III subunit gamma/tau [Proteobacteria bacterium]|nr:DNA polymerase III subunit gamma/tau [Pseudomonadota bacterium]
MGYLVLARKYRPQTFGEVVAQERVTTTLKNAIAANRVAHALCLCGPRGTGKTTVARVFAKAMNCAQGPAPVPCNQCGNCLEITAGRSVDVYEIDGASNNGVEQIRDLRENIRYTPAQSRYKIYIIDEVHMLSTAAFNALLKTLEEPPAHVLFVLATTESHKIPVTILSRCQRLDFSRIRPEDVVAHLARLCKKENYPAPEESLWLISRASGGCMRDALSLLDQVMAYSEGADPARIADILGAVDRDLLADFAGALLSRDAALGLAVLDGLYQRGFDVKRLTADLLGFVRNCAVAKAAKDPGNLVDAGESELARVRDLVKDVSLSTVNHVLSALAREETAMRLAGNPRLAMEVAIIRICEAVPALSVEDLIEKLDALQRSMGPGGPPAPALPASASPAPPAPRTRAAGPPEPGRSASPDPEPRDAGMPPLPEEPAGFSEVPPLVDEATPAPAPDWDALLAHVRKENPMLGAHLARCEPREVERGRLTVMARGSLCQHFLTTPENHQDLEKLLSGRMGCPVTFSVVLPDKQDAEPDARAEALKKKKRQQKAVNHPLVTEALTLFNGRIVDFQES